MTPDRPAQLVSAVNAARLALTIAACRPYPLGVVLVAELTVSWVLSLPSRMVVWMVSRPRGYRCQPHCRPADPPRRPAGLSSDGIES
jgi:hypothetical protein